MALQGHLISRYSILEPSGFYGKNNTWRNPRDFLVKRVSVLSIFIATAYDILRFSTINEIKKSKLTLNILPSPPRVCLHMSNDTPWQVKFISIVQRRRTSWPFPRRGIDVGLLGRIQIVCCNFAFLLCRPILCFFAKLILKITICKTIQMSASD